MGIREIIFSLSNPDPVKLSAFIANKILIIFPNINKLLKALYNKDSKFSVVESDARGLNMKMILHKSTNLVETFYGTCLHSKIIH
jgi:hypothetical protein